MDEKRVILTGRQSGKTAQMLQAAYDENYLLRQKLAKSEARVAELSNLCERLQHCAQGFYVDQGDYGHMEAIMKDYHWIMRASKPWRDAYIKRLQAEAVEQIVDTDPDGRSEDGAALISVNEIWDYAQSLRQQADEAERAGGAS